MAAETCLLSKFIATLVTLEGSQLLMNSSDMDVEGGFCREGLVTAVTFVLLPAAVHT